MMLDVVRQSAIPFTDNVLKTECTQLRCVKRVHGFELLSEIPKKNRLPAHVDLDINGLGRWQRKLSIYMPTKEQMARRAEMAPLFTGVRSPPGNTKDEV
jgi:hypothetical protein